eukprot:7587089-Alexandrium_andersonii.AAC.1
MTTTKTLHQLSRDPAVAKGVDGAVVVAAAVADAACSVGPAMTPKNSKPGKPASAEPRSKVAQSKFLKDSGKGV